MSNQSSNGPKITTSQMDGSGQGNIGNSVSLFRGNVTFPLTLLSLSGRHGLSVSLTAMYDSNVQGAVELSNRVAATGPLGLGWSLPLDQVTVSSDGTRSVFGSTYSVSAGGSGGALIATGESRPEAGKQPVYEFALTSYQFWRIRYIPEDERWEVVKENGTTYVYGGKSLGRGGIQWGLAHGNWVGSSSAAGATPYAVAWNLVETRTPWGDRIEYHYLNDEVSLSGGPPRPGEPCFTRASHLETVVDPLGRVVTLHYGPKLYDPSTGVCEYLPAHLDGQGQSPPAYQDRYETRYLRAIEVSRPVPAASLAGGSLGAGHAVGGRSKLLSIHLGYELENASSSPRDGSLVKRYLTHLSRISGDGGSGPSVTFAYELRPGTEATPVPTGAITSVTYPQGAIATYDYRQLQLEGARTAQNVDVSGAPGVWFGSSFVVLTGYENGSLAVSTYSWGGTWGSWSRGGTITGSISEASIRVAAADDWFALYYTDTSASPADHVYLFRRNPGQLDQWIESGPYLLPRSDGTAPTVAAAGTDFVVFANAVYSGEYASQPVIVFYRTASGWGQTSIGVSGDGAIALTGQGSYFAFCRYDSASATGAFQLFYYDQLSRRPVLGDAWSTALPLLQSPEATVDTTDWNLVFFGPGSTFFSTTYLTAVDPSAETLTYEVKVYEWSSSFAVSQQSGSYQKTLTVAAALDLPALFTEATGDQIGNCNLSARYDGVVWQEQTVPLDVSASGQIDFAYGSDLLVATRADGSISASRFDPASDGWVPMALAAPETASGGGPAPVGVGGGLAVIGTSLYQQGPESDWQQLGTLPAGTNPASVRMCGGGRIAFEVGTGTGASARFAFVVDGRLVVPDAGAQSSLDGQRFTVDGTPTAGSSLVGSGIVVTYAAAQGFSSARSLTLHRLVDQRIDAPLVAFAVVGLAIDGGAQTTRTTYWYDTSTATYDASGRVPQYSSVWSYPGEGATPLDAAFGAMEYRYLNGLSPDARGMFYPNQDSRENYSRLNGQLLFQRGHARLPGGALVMSSFSMSCTSVFQETASGPIDGVWSRVGQTLSASDVQQVFTVPATADTLSALDANSVPESLLQAFQQAGYTLTSDLEVLTELSAARWILVDAGAGAGYFLSLSRDRASIAILAGTSQLTSCTYDLSNGQPSQKKSTNCGLDGRTRVLSRATLHGNSATDGTGALIYPGLQAANMLTPVIQVTTSVDDQVTSIRAVTWTDRWNGEHGRWAPESFHQARRGDATFDFHGTPDPALWTQMAQIRLRDGHGQVLEYTKSDGVPRSVVYDAAGDQPVVSFTNGSLLAGEVLYAGFQPYEDLSAWSVDGGATPVTALLAAGDAHSGDQALRLPPGQTSATGLTTTLSMTPSQSSCFFSFWAKTAEGFDGDAGSAAFTLTAVQGESTVGALGVSIADTRGQWLHQHGVLELGACAPGVPVSVTLTAVNGKATAPLLLDDLCLSPLLGQAKAQVYDALGGATTAIVSRNGLSSYTVYDERRQASVSSASARRPSAAAASASSRRANGDRFSLDCPNVKLVLQPGDGGVFETFRDGDGWQQRWTQGGASGWGTKDGCLVHGGGQADTLAMKAVRARTGIAVQSRVQPCASLSAPVEMAIGASVSVRWVPGDGLSTPGTWALMNPATGLALAAPVTPGPLFELPARFAATLAPGPLPAVLAEALAARGLCLSDSGVTVAAVTPPSLFRIDDPQRFQSYLVTVGAAGLSLSCATLPSQVWTLVATPGAVLFHAGGLPVFACLCPVDLTGAPSVTATDPVALGFLSVLADPSILLAYQDGSGKTLQEQVLDGTTTSVRAVLYDSIGRPVGSTKWASFPAVLPGYRQGFATAPDPTNGTVGGEIGAYYAGQNGRTDDQGYPYAGVAYESSPTSRVIEQGKPGKDFAIDPSNPDRHTTRMAYGGSGQSLQLPGGAFQIVQQIDPNGVPRFQITDKIGQVVKSLSGNDASGSSFRQSAVEKTFSRCGSTVTQKSPNYFAPPASSGAAPPASPAAWVVVQERNLLGQTLVLRTPDQGVRTCLYDSAGRLRFEQDEAGRAASPERVCYARYDAIGRLVESGVTASTWAALAAHVDDPSWPAEPLTWRKRLTYDGDGSDPNALGRLVTAESNNGDSGVCDVVETFTYDVAGHVRTATQCLPAADGVVATTYYEQDAAGRLQRIVYPDGDEAAGTAPTTVFYRYDSRGLVESVGRSSEEPATYGSYTYDDNGILVGETLLPGSAGEIVRTWTLSSPGWPTAVDDALTAQATSYTAGGVGGAAFYDGTVAAESNELSWQGAPDAVADSFAYAVAGWLTEADEGQSGAVWGHDANGNITSRNGADCTYAPGTNQLTRLPGSTSDDFGYDQNGNLTASRPRGITAIDYDPSTQLPRSLQLQGTAGSSSLAFLYGSRQQRAQKTVRDGSGAVTFTKTYVRGVNASPLVEKSGPPGGPTRVTALIQGPRGVLALVSGGAVSSVLLDRLGSVQAVADAAGNPVAGFLYSPYGAVTTWGDPGVIDYRFTGQELDAESGLYNYNLRLYDADLGRFCAPDPAAQYPSPYLYAGNNPLRYVDPTGALGEDALIEGLVVGATLLFGAVLVVCSFGTDTPEVVAGETMAIAGEVGFMELTDDALFVTEEVITEGIDAAFDVADEEGTEFFDCLESFGDEDEGSGDDFFDCEEPAEEGSSAPQQGWAESIGKGIGDGVRKTVGATWKVTKDFSKGLTGGLMGDSELDVGSAFEGGTDLARTTMDQVVGGVQEGLEAMSDFTTRAVNGASELVSETTRSTVGNAVDAALRPVTDAVDNGKRRVSRAWTWTKRGVFAVGGLWIADKVVQAFS